MLATNDFAGRLRLVHTYVEVGGFEGLHRVLWPDPEMMTLRESHSLLETFIFDETCLVQFDPLDWLIWPI
jgi:hypothetical protein